jgi:hypothetical protein
MGGLDSATAIGPLLAAVENSGVVAAGSGAMEEVLVAMEQHLDGILDRAEDEVWRIDRETEARITWGASETRRQITMLRSALVQRSTSLAQTYESLLGLLDEAERTVDRITDAALER